MALPEGMWKKSEKPIATEGKTNAVVGSAAAPAGRAGGAVGEAPYSSVRPEEVYRGAERPAVAPSTLEKKVDDEISRSTEYTTRSLAAYLSEGHKMKESDPERFAAVYGDVKLEFDSATNIYTMTKRLTEKDEARIGGPQVAEATFRVQYTTPNGKSPSSSECAGSTLALTVLSGKEGKEIPIHTLVNKGLTGKWDTGIFYRPSQVTYSRDKTAGETQVNFDSGYDDTSEMFHIAFKGVPYGGISLAELRGVKPAAQPAADKPSEIIIGATLSEQNGVEKRLETAGAARTLESQVGI